MIDTLEANREKAAELEIGEIIERNLIDGQKVNSKLQSRKLSEPNSKQDVSDLSHLGPDSYRDKRDKPETRNSKPAIQSYSLMTMHRPSNVDENEVLTPLFRFLAEEVTEDMPLIWPIHPRAQSRLKEFGLWEEALNNERLILLQPIGYHDMLRLNMDARIMLTDSGGLQEECCVLGTPCLTLRWNTERPVTLREHGGASILVGNNVERIRKEYKDILTFERNPQRPDLWDGKTAQRAVSAILNCKQKV
jgi:UDP-N-acetylglucosamine 2-epimerase (non-hydrolysing)